MSKIKTQFSYLITPVKARAEMIAREVNEAWERVPKTVVTKHPAGFSVGPEGEYAETPPCFQEICTYARGIDAGICAAQSKVRRKLSQALAETGGIGE